jgi:hypothetical protein
MNLVLQLITNEAIDRELKISMIYCIGDLVMSLKEKG